MCLVLTWLLLLLLLIAQKLSQLLCNLRFKHLTASRLGFISAQRSFLVVLLLAAAAQFTRVDGCNSVDFYRCSNGNCISRQLVNNSINDCIDNSDEVANPCREPLFSCRNDRCIMSEWVLDGSNDCIDGTDEAKLIGTRCTMAVNCCFCSDYIPHSECGPEGVCRCSIGYYSNQLGTACIRRGLNDSCVESRDCSASVQHSGCSSTDVSVGAHDDVTPDDVIQRQCGCDVGYYALDKFTCKSREIGDRCSNDPDCNVVVNDTRCHDNVCQCVPRYYATSPSHCVIRRLGGQCEMDKQCREVIEGETFCDTNKHQCDCVAGHRQRVWDLKACLLRQLGERCTWDDDCRAAVSVAECGTVTGRCQCPRSHVTIRRGSDCRPRWPGEACMVDDDCLAAVNNSVCVNERCACAYDHTWYPATKQCYHDKADTLLEAVGVSLSATVVVLALCDLALLVGVLWFGVDLLRQTVAKQSLQNGPTRL